jgi:hypothetical protein
MTANHPIFYLNISHGVSGIFWRIGARMQDQKSKPLQKKIFGSDEEQLRVC